MKYSLTLLDKAASNCGSFYRLAQAMDVHESAISAIRAGRRDLPLSWVYELAILAELDPGEQLGLITKERNSRLSGHAA
jgi:plasmid maintenance system antidote protein VapI